MARDLWCSTDWMVARLIRAGVLLPLRAENIPHRRNLQPALRDAPFDKGRRYSLPWQTGFTGIAYNTRLTGGGRRDRRTALHRQAAEGPASPSSRTSATPSA